MPADSSDVRETKRKTSPLLIDRNIDGKNEVVSHGMCCQPSEKTRGRFLIESAVERETDFRQNAAKMQRNRPTAVPIRPRVSFFAVLF